MNVYIAAANGNSRTVWVVLKCFRESAAVEFCGVFDTQDAADAAATSDLHMVGPCTVNESVPDEAVLWPGAYYPKAVPS